MQKQILNYLLVQVASIVPWVEACILLKAAIWVSSWLPTWQCNKRCKEAAFSLVEAEEHSFYFCNLIGISCQCSKKDFATLLQDFPWLPIHPNNLKHNNFNKSYAFWTVIYLHAISWFFMLLKPSPVITFNCYLYIKEFRKQQGFNVNPCRMGSMP